MLLSAQVKKLNVSCVWDFKLVHSGAQYTEQSTRGSTPDHTALFCLQYRALVILLSHVLIRNSSHILLKTNCISKYQKSIVQVKGQCTKGKSQYPPQERHCPVPSLAFVLGSSFMLCPLELPQAQTDILKYFTPLLLAQYRHSVWLQNNAVHGPLSRTLYLVP